MKRTTHQVVKIFLALLLLGLGTVMVVNSLVNPDKSIAKKNADTMVMGSVSDVARQVSPSIVGISNLRSSGDMFNQSSNEASGSGVIYNRSGYIITNNHVVSGAEKLIVSLADGQTIEAELVGTDPRTDLAVIKIKTTTKLSPARLGDSDRLVVGQQVVAIGNPLGLRFARSVTSGVVSGLNRIINTEEGFIFRLIQTDAAINPGNSGGALVNLDGEVIGINTIKIAMSGFEGMGFSIPSQQVKKVVQQIIKNGRVIRPLLGIRILGEIDAQLAKFYNLPITQGVVIEPLANSPALEAGLKPNDIISKIQGKPIQTGLELQEKIFTYKVGDKVKLEIIRLPGQAGGKMQTLTKQVELVKELK